VIVVAVTLGLVKPHDETFMRTLLTNAASSRQESGCRQFDVGVAGDGASVFLYEVYDDARAFEFHRSTPHFAEYDRITKPLIAHRDVKIYTLKSRQ
jgi:autoinducer 2-degrading protein